MTEQKRVNQNRQKLTELYPAFAAKIRRVITALEKGSIRPRIQAAYRTPADQLKAFQSGHSKLKFGFHNVTGAGGKPESLAVDLLDDDHPLHPPTSYLLRLAAAAASQGLESGILWGLPAALQAGVKAAIAARDFGATVKVGWDPAHLQPTGITVQEAKAGKRPA